MELAPQSPDTLFALAEYHYRVDRDNLRAIAELRRVDQVRPNDANIVGLLAAVLRAQGQWKESLENFRRAVALDPANLRHLHDLASVLAAARRFDEARTAQRRLVERTQDAAEQLMMGWLGYLATGATAEVDDVWRQPGLADDVRNWELSWAMRTGNMADAIRLDRAGSLGGVEPFGLGPRRVSVAIVRRVQGNAEWGKAELEQTAIWFRDATVQGPVEPRHWANLAQIEALLGNREDALRCARKAIELSQSAAVHAVVRNPLGSTLAFVEAWTDAKDAAIERYARQLQLPYGCTTVAGLMGIEVLVTVHVMKRDPTFAPLRGHPRWEALLNDPKNNAPLF
jgi:tetratricopeptide (TPR) repeat protein